ncbi:hypothetical protein [Moraxella pluranimalium]|nr:hypothetical protein [Moraxella pluranimalium]
MHDDDYLEHSQMWQALSIDERLQMIDDVCKANLDADDALGVLHELFFLEMEHGANPVVTDTLAAAIAERIDPTIVEKMAEELGLPPLPKPKKRRTRKATAKSADADTDSRDVQVKTDEVVEAVEAVEAPKKRRTRKKAANADDSSATDEVDTPKPKRRTRKKASDDVQADESSKPKRRKSANKRTPMAQETMLEFVEDANGVMTLREVGDTEALVSIAFSDKVKEMLGGDARMVGQAMIHAAIASVVQRQANFWHAHVYDEEPVHYS